MSYVALARKFRPQSFDSVSGQEHVTRALTNSVKNDRISHAYIFSGPRGVGKTSLARILAKCLNCEQGPTPSPCGECTNCVEITAGKSLAVREIDGASHNSVDNVRDLIDTLRSLPAPGNRYKVYIIDEVHMLSTSAFNALLKSLEEPPKNTVFILATTELHKIPQTVISRCQPYEFRSISVEAIENRLRDIARQESIDCEVDVFRLVARLADGSMRDAQSLFDRVRSFSDGKISVAEASASLGVVNQGELNALSAAIFTKEAGSALSVIDKIFSAGIDPRLFLNEFVNQWRNLLLVKVSNVKELSAFGIIDEHRAELARQIETLELQDLQDLVHMAREGADAAIRSAYPRYSLEGLVVRMSTREPVCSVAQLVASLRKGARSSASAQKKKPEITQEITQSTSKPLSEDPPKQNPQPSEPPQVVSQTAPQVASRVAVPQAVAPPAPVSAPVSPQTTDLDWRGFVLLVREKGAGMLSEYLKRVAVKRFSQGFLDISAPSFAAKYLRDNTDRLNDLLCEFTSAQSEKWQIDVHEQGKGEAAKESLHTQTIQAKKKLAAEKVEDAENHPAVVNLRKIFPGSTIKK